MKEKKSVEPKKAEPANLLEPENPLEQAETESYFSYKLRKMCLKFFVKEGGTVNIHVESFLSGKPPNPPPY